LIIREHQGGKPLFSLSHVSAEKDEKPAVVSIYGTGFHPGIRAVMAENLVNEEALLWQQLIGVSAKSVDVKNDLALVTCYGKKLVTIRFHKDQRPEILGSLEMPGPVKHFKIVGDQALVGMQRHAGFYLVDLQDPEVLKLGRHFPVSGLATSMVVDQDMVYFTDLYQGVGRIDLSAENPALEMLASIKSPWRIALQDNRLVVGTLKGRVYLFDITRDGQLLEAGRLDYPVNVRGLAFVDERLAVTLADDRLLLLNLSTWPRLNNPVQLTLPGSPLLLERIPGRASLAVSLIAGGMAMIDVSQPGVPRLSGYLKKPKTFLGMKLQSESFWGVSRDGLEIFSLEKIAGKEYSLLATEAMINQERYKLHSWNDHVYGYRKNYLVDFGKKAITETHSASRFMAIAGEVGVSIFEQRENNQVQRVGSLVSMEGARDALFRGGYLYIVHQDGLRILSGSRPEELVVTSDLQLSGRPWQLDLLDSGYLLITTRYEGFLVVDVNNPQQPVQVASMTSPKHLQSINTIQDILVDGQRAYISQGAGGVQVVDMSSPSRPQLMQIIDTPGQAKRMILYDDLLLVADGEKGFFMIDVKDPDGALPIGTVPTPLRIDHLAVVNDGLIASSHPGGTMKLPLPQRMKNLQMVNGGEMRVDVEVVKKGEYAYLYDVKVSRQMEISIQ
ncbi:MAG: hypothetical protein KAU27_02525, partial [Desulfuromonadales bacterium]|nr:hypothetical protein [Desulfuromonadales bacterium]